MTIHITTSKVTYFGDGAQTVFAYNYRIFQDTNLIVYIDGVIQTYVTDYTVTNNGDETGGTVVFAAAPANGAVVIIERLLSNQQLLDLVEYDKFPAESVEAALDYIVLLVQQNTTAQGNVLKAADDMPPDVDLTVPAPGAGEFFKYTADGLAIETTDITNLGAALVASATDLEITDGTETADRLISPAQVKLGVESHETPPITSVFNVAWVSVVDTLPGTPNADTLYLVRE